MRIGWYRHRNIYRREKRSTFRIIIEWKSMYGKPKGRPGYRWKDQVENDCQELKVNDWKKNISEGKKTEESTACIS